MNVAVYSGSFNPLHIGHLSILRHLTVDADFDAVYLVVSPQSPFKDASNVDSAAARFDAASQALLRHPELNARADDIELHMDPPHFTYRTLLALKDREPENDFTLVVGADNLDAFRRWKDYEKILLEFGIAVCPRSGYEMEDLAADLIVENGDYRITLLDAPLVDVSSTQIRDAMSRGEDVSDLLM